MKAPSSKTSSLEKSAVLAWQRAASELNVQVVAPYCFALEGKKYSCIAYLADFGGKKGILVKGSMPPSFETDQSFILSAKAEGFAYSFVNLELYSRFDTSRFQDALRDWGYFGADSARPSWFELPAPAAPPPKS